MHTSTSRSFFGNFIAFLFIFTPHVFASDCESHLIDRSQILLHVIRHAAKNDPTDVAKLVAKAFAVKPLANPFAPRSLEFKVFQRYFKDLTSETLIDQDSAKQFRRSLMMNMTFEECYYLAALTQGQPVAQIQAIPSARKP